MDLVLERIELRARPRPFIDRRTVTGDRPTDRLSMQPRPPVDLADPQPLDEVQPTDLGPLLHPDHPGPPELAPRKRAQARRPLGHSPRWSTFQPAQVVQFSPAADSVGVGGERPGRGRGWTGRTRSSGTRPRRRWRRGAGGGVDRIGP